MCVDDPVVIPIRWNTDKDLLILQVTPFAWERFALGKHRCCEKDSNRQKEKVAELTHETPPKIVMPMRGRGWSTGDAWARQSVHGAELVM